jgi:CRISPR-associated endonuclease/helicase Cas3
VCKNILVRYLAIDYGHHSKLYSRLPFKEDKGIDNKKYVTSKGALILNLRSFYQQIRDNNLTTFLNLNWDRCIRIFADPISFQDTIKLSTTDNRDVGNTLAIKEFLEMNILYSALLQADKGSFKEWETPIFDISINTSSLIKPESYLGDLRRDFQKEALENHDPTLGINVLNAPTGIGKTKLFLDFLEGYRMNSKLERVFYFSPLLALTEDFEKKITETVVTIDDILVYNHLFSGTLLEKEDFKSEDKREYNNEKWFEYESFNKKFIITTTQRLLITLFSNRSSDKLKLLSFKNSILIIDEIQTIPKLIIRHLIAFLQQLSKYMKSKILLVSATIPYELSHLPKVKISKSLVNSYLEKTEKNISFIENLTLPDTSDRKKRILIMANTRKKTANIFNRIKEEVTADNNKQKALYYISRGIRKKDRIKIIDELTPSIKQENYKANIIVVSTQVIEAGIDISFSHIYREAAPLDSVIQIMGRLNREGEYKYDSYMTIFQEEVNHRPYSELEYNDSLPILKKVKTSKELYAQLPDYYEAVSTKNARNKKLNDELNSYISDMNFEQVWEFVNLHALPDDDKDNVFIPYTTEEWYQIKDAFLKADTKSQRNSLSTIYKKFMTLTASLPRSINLFKIKDIFDDELFTEGILMPKVDYFQNSEKLKEIYDEDLGLDILLHNDQLFQ